MHELKWYYRQWYGFLDLIPRVYDAGYFDKYVGYENTNMGKQITQARMRFVASFYDGPLLDVGIGSGHFVASRQNTFGYDINPKGIAWLKERGLYRDLGDCKFPAYSFFDSFEHIKDPVPMLEAMDAGTMLFISIPIFDDACHVMRSKHFRPDEHYWYFTGIGFVKFMAQQGFSVLDIDDFETQLGREDIKSFAFIKRQLIHNAVNFNALEELKELARVLE